MANPSFYLGTTPIYGVGVHKSGGASIETCTLTIDTTPCNASFYVAYRKYTEENGGETAIFEGIVGEHTFTDVVKGGIVTIAVIEGSMIRGSVTGGLTQLFSGFSPQQNAVWTYVCTGDATITFN